MGLVKEFCSIFIKLSVTSSCPLELSPWMWLSVHQVQPHSEFWLVCWGTGPHTQQGAGAILAKIIESYQGYLSALLSWGQSILGLFIRYDPVITCHLLAIISHSYPLGIGLQVAAALKTQLWRLPIEHNLHWSILLMFCLPTQIKENIPKRYTSILAFQLFKLWGNVSPFIPYLTS